MFESQGGILRMSEALSLGISRYQLYKMVNEGLLEKVNRGVYRLASLEPISNPDFVSVSLQVRSGVICLISALAIHHLTTQIPHVVSVAVKRDSRVPKIQYPPTRVYVYSKSAYEVGIDEQNIDGVLVKIYCKEKTIADCFKYRNKIGFEVALEALKTYLNQRQINIPELLKYAKICRVYKIMQPYLQAYL